MIYPVNVEGLAALVNNLNNPLQSIPHCRKVDDIFADLARKYAMARFVRVPALDLEFDLVGSSAILGYRGGLLVANLVRLVDYVNARFEVETVEDVLLT